MSNSNSNSNNTGSRTEAAIQRLVAGVEESGIDSLELDEAVHEAKSAEASEINNGGHEDQIRYLVEALGVAGVEEVIKGIGSN